MRDFDIDGHYISAPTRAAAIQEYVDTFGTQPENVEEWEPEIDWEDDAEERQAEYDDEWGDPLDVPSYAS